MEPNQYRVHKTKLTYVREECLCGALIINEVTNHCGWTETNIRWCLNTVKDRSGGRSLGWRSFYGRGPQPKCFCRRICWWVRGTTSMQKSLELDPGVSHSTTADIHQRSTLVPTPAIMTGPRTLKVTCWPIGASSVVVVRRTHTMVVASSSSS